MADENSTIFNKQAAEKLRSPDDLERYVRVTNPSVWVVLGACVLLLLGLLAWGVFGAVTTSITATGTVADGKFVCLISPDEVSHVQVGDIAVADGRQLTVEDIGDIPIAPSEAKEMLGSEYLVSTLMPGDWGYPVTLAGTGVGEMNANVPYPVTITTHQVAPISLILG